MVVTDDLKDNGTFSGVMAGVFMEKIEIAW